MAGAGYKLFNTGDVLTAAQVNTYLMEQTVMVFANAAARTTALSGVVSEGMISYLKDTNAVEVYDGSNWVSSDDPNAIQNTIVDAKGDLIAATANDTPARLAVGANNTVLIADSAESTGLRWGGGWTTWTPTYSNITVGNGTVTARYQQIGKTVNFIFKFTLGSTSSIGSTPYFTLPVTAADGGHFFGTFGDAGVGSYDGGVDCNTTTAYPIVFKTDGTYAFSTYISATIPYTWVSGDNMLFRGTYEAA